MIRFAITNEHRRDPAQPLPVRVPVRRAPREGAAAEKPPLPPVKLDLGGGLQLSMRDGVWRGGGGGAGSSEDDLAEIARLRGEVEALKDRLRVVSDERNLVDFKNKLLVEMVGCRGCRVRCS